MNQNERTFYNLLKNMVLIGLMETRHLFVAFEI